MPYIKQEHRKALDRLIEPFDRAIFSATPGDMNYIVTRLVTMWLDACSRDYTRMSAALSIFEAAKLELYRRVVAPYEDRKRKENGDVYGEET